MGPASESSRGRAQRTAPRAPGDAPQTNLGMITYGWIVKEDLSELEAVNLRLSIVLRIFYPKFQRANPIKQTRNKDDLKHRTTNSTVDSTVYLKL